MYGFSHAIPPKNIFNPDIFNGECLTYCGIPMAQNTLPDYKILNYSEKHDYVNLRNLYGWGVNPNSSVLYDPWKNQTLEMRRRELLSKERIQTGTDNRRVRPPKGNGTQANVSSLTVNQSQHLNITL